MKAFIEHLPLSALCISPNICIGILIDENRATPANAKQLAVDTGANYRQFKISNSLKPFVGSITAYPHTIFVNAGGQQIGNAYNGVKSKADWKKVIDEMLGFIDKRTEP